ncbi:MAG: LytTR family DNA-binding domain-containing protein, partial [Maribacter sp.]
ICTLDTVKATVDFFSKDHQAALVFMDIDLADGLSFEVFDQVDIKTPIIFTTAYDQNALKAFKVNSIDYLLKPIDEEELANALEQFETQAKQQGIDEVQMKNLMSLIQTKPSSYKKTFLVGMADNIVPVKTEQIAYFFIDTGVVKAVTLDDKSYALDVKLEEIEESLDPNVFYRANRQFIVRRDAIVNIKYHFNSKLLVYVEPACTERIVVSKAKSSDFKKWMGS